MSRVVVVVIRQTNPLYFQRGSMGSRQARQNLNLFACLVSLSFVAIRVIDFDFGDPSMLATA